MKDVGARAMAGLAAALMVGTGGYADAMPLDIADGWNVNWNTTLSMGSSWRAQSPDTRLYTAADGASVGLSGGSGATSHDANDLNYGKGKPISQIVKVVSDVDVKYADAGGLIRIKAWDDLIRNQDAAYGNEANGYQHGAPLSDNGFEPLQRFENIQLLDAYVYNSFDIGNNPLQVRLGRQVINWGESLFFQGVNQINPLDIPALRRPGSEIKEGLLPVWAAYGNLGLGGGISVEGFYQLQWEPTTADACGTYWSTLDVGVGSDPGQCNKVTIGNMTPANAIAAGMYVPVINGRKAHDSGQGGAALKVPVDKLDTEFGLYAMNLNSRTPIISTRTGSWGNAVVPQQTALGGTLNPIMAAQINQSLVGASGVNAASAYWEYPNNVQYYGVSAVTNLEGWSLGSELSYTPNLPVQRNPNDMLNGTLTGKGPLGNLYASAGSLTDVPGYDRLQKTQFQINGIRTLNGILGAGKTTLLGEAAFQWNNAPNYKDGTSVRYGRALIFGTASSATGNTCTDGTNPSAAGCKNDGFVTPFSWGYRLRGELEYPQFAGTALTFTPSLAIAQDVQGVSADGQLNQGRVQVGLNGRFSYDNRYNLDFGYVYFAPWAEYDPLRDHSYYSINLSMTF